MIFIMEVFGVRPPVAAFIGVGIRKLRQVAALQKDYFPNRNDSSNIGSSPFSPTSSTLVSSGASEVVSISSVTPVLPPDGGGRKTTRPQILTSPFAVFRDMPSKRNS